MKFSTDDIAAHHCLMQDWKNIVKRRDSVCIKKTLRFDSSLLQKCDTVQKTQEYFYLKLFPETVSQVLHKNGNSSEIH